MKKVLFVCQANVGRSQMAEAFYNYLTESENAISAGAQDFREKYHHHPTLEIIKSMEEKGIDISRQKIKVVDRQMCEQAERIVVLCHRSFCADYILNDPKTTYLPIQDPHQQKLETINRIRDQIEELIKSLIGYPTKP